MERDGPTAAAVTVSRSGGGATALLAGLAFAAFVALRRPTAHGSDVFFLMRWLDDGTVHPQHPLYLVLARLWRWLLSPLGLGTMPVLATISAFGAAIGVAGVHRAALSLGGDRGRAAWLALTVAALPAVLFFATIGELQGPFFGGVGIAAWRVARWLRSGGLGAAGWAGLATAGASLLHATGHLLVPLAAGAFFAAGPRHRPRFSSIAMFVAVHAAAYLGGFLALRATGPVLPGDPGSFLAERADVAAWIGYVPRALWWQWCVPFAPVALLAWLGFVRTPARTAWLAIAVAVYLAVSTALAHAADEVGGYLLPLAVPAALLTFDALPRRAWPLVFALTVLAAVLHRTLRPSLTPDFALTEAVAAEQRPTVWLVGDEAESWGARWRTPDVELCETWVTRVALGQRVLGHGEALDAATLGAWLELTAAPVLAAKKRLMVTAHAVAVLTADFPAFAAAWQQFASAHHAEPIAYGPWHGFAVD